MPQASTPHIIGTTRVTQENWAAVRAALVDFGERFADLIVSAPDPSVPATKDWSVAETAAHVTGIAWNYTALAAGGDKPLPIPGVKEAMGTVTVDDINRTLNPMQLAGLPERDPHKLAELLRSSIKEVLALTAGAPPEMAVGWLGGSHLPLAGVLAHLLNELHIHGRDIADGVGAPWPIPDEQAALFFDLFIVEILRYGYGVLLEGNRPLPKRKIAVEFRSSYNAPVTIVLDGGEVTIAAGPVPADVRIRFRPAALNLMLFHRVSPMRAALSGSVVVTGRRPWLLPAFMRKLRMP
jgi:uncharacterized protein (TIGR03083 family)